MKQRVIILVITLVILVGCQTLPGPPMKTVEYVDLERFMGDWYVIANIPTFLERGAHNAVESYRLNEDGSIATRFTFRDGRFDGDVKQYQPTGFVK
ncbi:MAG TPA: lipocalin family protein, partial [Candidatus Competibacteraceae bacterium]|nr:lipocalin family protein [Candidatus Competibacteraceae bacterium]